MTTYEYLVSPQAHGRFASARQANQGDALEARVLSSASLAFARATD
jgi:hypothetical protein